MQIHPLDMLRHEAVNNTPGDTAACVAARSTHFCASSFSASSLQRDSASAGSSRR